jgi:hypothetical protein
MSITPRHHYDLYRYTEGGTPLPRRAGIVGYLGNPILAPMRTEKVTERTEGLAMSQPLDVKMGNPRVEQNHDGQKPTEITSQ